MAQPARLLFLFVAMVAPARPAAAQVDPAAQPTPVLDIVDLMDLMVKPAYDEVEKALAHPPHDRQAWAAIYQKAARLAGNLNGPRAQRAPDSVRGFLTSSSVAVAGHGRVAVGVRLSRAGTLVRVIALRGLTRDP